jgi:hypothetical protein
MTRQTITLEAATDLFKQFLARQGAPTDDPYFSLTRGYDRRLGAGLFADEATVSVQAQPASFSLDKDVEVAFQIKLNWSSTHRTIAQATAALATYREAVDFAARCEAFLKELGRVVVPARAEAAAK